MDPTVDNWSVPGVTTVVSLFVLQAETSSPSYSLAAKTTSCHMFVVTSSLLNHCCISKVCQGP